tara:strand:- start:12764 stop:13519 length:756 start_codon:yes stop_codon:yes gene_type:complete
MLENEVTENQEEVSLEGEATTTEPAPRPEFIPEKFWDIDTGNINLEEFGKSYSNLEKYVGGKKDELRQVVMDELALEAEESAPESYELPPLPANITEEMIQANPMTDWWGSFCKENSYPQEIYEEGINKYVDSFVGSLPDIAKETELLGENAEARLDAVNSWASSFFPPEEYEAVATSLGATAQGVEALERIMETQREGISRSGVVAQPERALTLDDVRGMMKDKRYYDSRERDMAFVRKVDDAFSRLYRG